MRDAKRRKKTAHKKEWNVFSLALSLITRPHAHWHDWPHQPFYTLFSASLSFPLHTTRFSVFTKTHTQTRKKKEKRRVAMEAAPFSFHPARSLLFCYMTEWPRLGPSLSRLSCFFLFFFSPLLLILLGPIMRVGGDAALSTQCALSWYIYEAKGEAAQAKLWAHENEENEE
jgi:hypothetical protein